MPYLVIDPVDPYAGDMMAFLARQTNLSGVAVFSSWDRWNQWRFKWKAEYGRFVVDEYLAPQAGTVDQLARRIGHEWPNLAGVIPWDEMHMIFGAELGDRLGLGWNPARVIERCRDKYVMKAWLREHARVRINQSRMVRDGTSALAFQEELGRWPIVVKPTESAGSKDVYFAGDRGELLGYCQQVLESGSGEVLLEEYVGGTELCVNGQTDANGDLLVSDVWRYDRRPSHGQPNIYFQAIKVDSGEPVFSALAEYAAEIVRALEVRRAPIHLEVKVDDRGPCLIEVGARLPGGNLPVLASKLHGRSLFELAAAHYIGHLPLHRSDLDLGRYDRYQSRVIIGVQSHEIGRIEAVHGLAEVERLPSFDDVGMIRSLGRRAPMTTDLDTRAWELYLIHPDPRQIARDADAVHRLLHYS